MAGIYNIPAEYSLLDVLAQGLLSQNHSSPLELSRYTLFLPTRQDCKELQKAFLRQSQGEPLLLPKMLPLGDLDQDEELILNTPLPDLPPVLPKFKRQGLLTKLILHFTEQHAGLVSPHSAASAVKLAQALMNLIDDAQVEGVDWDKLADLVPSHLAAHWQITLDFLNIVREHWPKILEGTGHVEPQAYNILAVERLIDRWQTHPPTHPVIAAGSTGTRPSTARLLEVISTMDKGAVILPGFDPSVEVHSSSHPLYSHTKLLERLQFEPEFVRTWGPLADIDEDGNALRGKLFLKSLEREPATLDPFQAGQAIKRCTYIKAETPQDEALAIAVRIRKALQAQGKTVALIAADDKIFERVRAELKRWEIPCESNSQSLRATPQGVLLLLILGAVHSHFSAHSVLALLKHPLVRAEFVDRLELKVLRGPVLKPGLDTLANAARQCGVDLLPFADTISTLASLMAEDTVSLSKLLPALLDVAEGLAKEKEELWRGNYGESLSTFFSELLEAAEDYPSIKGQDFYEFMEVMLAGYVTLSHTQTHPRLTFLKPHQARLYHADLNILAGLNEDCWPRDVGADAWMNHSMRKELGLSTSEQKLGLSTHDFYIAFSATEVILTRALRDQGAPTVPSRWLMRLGVSLKKVSLSLPHCEDLQHLCQVLDEPHEFVHPQRPAPCPPVSSRPRQLSVTQVETWMRDPYALYARHILRLKPLDDIAMSPSASDRGVLFHRAFEEYIKNKESADYQALLDIGRRLFAPYMDHVDVSFFWWPKFEQVAQWFYETHTRLNPQRVFTEIRGAITLDTPSGPFTLVAQADRIDQRTASPIYTLIDYKTGQLPAARDVEQGLSPQMPLETAILMRGGFEGLEGQPHSIEFWWLKGGAAGGTIQTLRRDPGELAIEALEGLQDLIEYYDQLDTTYPAMPSSSRALKYNDYAHLARIQEWGNVA